MSGGPGRGEGGIRTMGSNRGNGGGDCLLLLSIYNPAVKNTSAVCACVCVHSIRVPRQTPCAPAAMTTPALRSGPRRCHLRQAAPTPRAASCITSFSFFFFFSFLNKHYRKLPHTLRVMRSPLCSPLGSTTQQLL